jgi:nucleoside-diphosphate-sugar epimerase
MRLLVLGGTLFVSRAVAAEAVRRGHEVVCAARGRTGSVPDGAKLVVVDRDTPNGLAALAGESFDAVVDVAKISYPWVAHALDVLADSAAHWTFVSSISVYRDGLTRGQRTDAPVLAPRREEVRAGRPLTDPELYGAIKVASENAVLERLGDRAFVVRPGLITGPGDMSDRFGYWPGRMARGGRVLVPDAPDAPAQIVDVRDLADWIVSAAERKLVGVFDAIGPSRPLNDLLADIAATVGADVELVKASPQALTAAGVQPWMGPRSLPLWVTEEDYGLGAHDPTPSIEAGMPVRPFADAVLGALEQERALGLDRERKAGLSLAEEAEVLATL